MRKSAIIKQTEAFERVDSILDRLKTDKVFSDIVNKKYMPLLKKGRGRRTSTNKKYKLVGKILEEEYGFKVLSDITIWRLLKIKEKSEADYQKVISGKESIKKIYDELFEEEKIIVNVEKPKEVYLTETLDLINLENFLEITNNQIEDWEKNLTDEPDIFKLKKIDEQIFKLRKSLGKVIVKYDDETI